MKKYVLYHYFSQRGRESRLKSTYEVGSRDGTIVLRATGSAVKVLRFLLRSGFEIPAEMNGPQVTEYTVELRME